MRAFHKATSLYWAIHEPYLQTVLAVLAREQGDVETALKIREARDSRFDEDTAKESETDALQSAEGDRLEGTRRTTVRNKTAIIRVEGVLVRRADFFSEISGAVSIERLAQDFNVALNDDRIEAIVLYIDSPGGAVNGINEFAQMIYDARDKKNITAYCGGTCASGAYWLASATSQITVDPTAVVGSIGVIAAWLDNKGAAAMAGFKEMQVVSSQSPRKRLDPDSHEGRNQIQQTVDSLAEVFVTAVARNRSVSVEKVLSDFGRGGVLVGQAAVDAGLVDRLGSFEEGLAELSPSDPGLDAGMKKKKTSAEDETQPVSATVVAVSDEEGEEMNFKKFFGLMTDEERKEAAAALGSTEGNGAQAMSSAANPGASAQGSSEELERVRKDAAAKDEELKQLRADQRTGKVDAFVKAQLEANKIVPAEEAALREEYLQALLDDEQYPVAQGATSRAARVEARQAARPAHILTEETMKADPPAGATVLTSKESDDPIEQAKNSAEKYAESRNQANRRAQVGMPSSAVN